MPNIVAYPVVLERLTAEGYRSLYHNSGAFGFAADAKTFSRGWIGPPDASIRESARSIVRQGTMPFDVSLTEALLAIWETNLTGPVWAMPKSHWAFELEFGHRDWLVELLGSIGVDPNDLSSLNNAAAIAFTPADQNAFDLFIRQMLNRLTVSDFQLAFPGYSTICTIHTRCQLWWTTTNAAVIEQLDDLLPGDGLPYA